MRHVDPGPMKRFHRPGRVDDAVRGSHEDAQRLRKVVALTDFLHLYGFTPAHVEAMDDADWTSVARCASRELGERVNPPGSPLSKQMILDAIRRRQPVSIQDFRKRLRRLEKATR